MINFKNVPMTLSSAGALAAILLAGGDAQALTSYSPSDLSAFGDASVKSVVQTVGIGSDHHAYMPATAIGITLGVDVGLDLTYIAFPTEFQQALATATGQAASQIGSGAPLPKLNIHKGLPFGIDLGFSFMSLSNGGSNLYKSYGGDIKWAFLRGMTVPAVALRLSGSYNNLFFIRTHTYAVDLMVSKDLVLIDPYAGAGLQFWSGELSVPAGVPTPAGVSLSQSGTNPRVFAGAMLKLAILRLAAQIDYSTAGLTTYGGKVSFGF